MADSRLDRLVLKLAEDVATELRVNGYGQVPAGWLNVIIRQHVADWGRAEGAEGSPQRGFEKLLNEHGAAVSAEGQITTSDYNRGRYDALKQLQEALWSLSARQEAEDSPPALCAMCGKSSMPGVVSDDMRTAICFRCCDVLGYKRKREVGEGAESEAAPVPDDEVWREDATALVISIVNACADRDGGLRNMKAGVEYVLGLVRCVQNQQRMRGEGEAVPLSAWQPIESAPKDKILWLYDAATRNHYLGWWYPGGGFNGEGCFGYEGESIGWSRRHQPTHWQIPTSPSEARARPVVETREE